MYNAASFIVLKSGDVLFGKFHDSHEFIIKENGLTDKEPIGFVRVKIAPAGFNYLLPLDQWIYKRDQDIIPKWYNDEWGEKLCREKLCEWASTHIYSSGSHKFENGNFSLIFIGNAKAEIIGQTGGECWFYDTSTGTVSGQTGGDCWFLEKSKRIDK